MKNGGAEAVVEGDAGEEVVEGAAAPEADPEVEIIDPEPAGDANPAPAEEGAAPGKGAGEDEGKTGKEGAEVTDPRDETIAELKARLETLEKGGSKKEEAPAYKEPSEEQWVQYEEESGLSRVALKFNAARESALIGRFEKMLEARFGKFEKTNTISAMAQKVVDGKRPFADIGKYSKGMEQFLSKFDPSVHSNEGILEMAYYAAKGKGSPEAVKKAASATERNRKIVGNGRPAAPNSGTKPSPIRLTQQQLALAKKAGMSPREYFDLLPKR